MWVQLTDNGNTICINLDNIVHIRYVPPDTGHDEDNKPFVIDATLDLTTTVPHGTYYGYKDSSTDEAHFEPVVLHYTGDSATTLFDLIRQGLGVRGDLAWRDMKTLMEVRNGLEALDSQKGKENQESWERAGRKRK